MPQAIFISIRRPVRAEGVRRATVQGYALSAPASRPAVVTLATPRPVMTNRPFATAFRALGLDREGA